MEKFSGCSQIAQRTGELARRLRDDFSWSRWASYDESGTLIIVRDLRADRFFDASQLVGPSRYDEETSLET